MKKIGLLILLLILLTGCTAEVNINVSSSGIYEQVNIVSYTNEYTTKEQIYSNFREYVPAFADDLMPDGEADTKKDGIEYYTRAMTDLGNGYKITYGYKFGFSEYNKARTVKEGFRDAIIQRDAVDKQILFTTDSGGLKYFNYYPDLENVKINITSEYNVKESNADYISNGVYTWNLNSNTKKSIYIVFDDPTYTGEVKDDSSSNNNVEIQEEDNKTMVSAPVEEKEERNAITKFMNENPFLTVIICIVLFFIIVLTVLKISKVNYK